MDKQSESLQADKAPMRQSPNADENEMRRVELAILADKADRAGEGLMLLLHGFETPLPRDLHLNSQVLEIPSQILPSPQDASHLYVRANRSRTLEY